MALSNKQQAFVDAYLATFNATEAARQANYRGNDATLASVGWENLRKTEIAEVISQRLQEKAMSADEVLMRLAEQARADLNDFVDIVGEPGEQRAYVNLVKARDAGKLHLLKKLTHKRVMTKAGSEIDTLEFEIHDAQSALALIGKAHKLFTDKIEHEVHGELTFSADDAVQAASELNQWDQKNSSEPKSNG